MREFESVAVPQFLPQACVCCGASQGPMADVQRELRGFGHVYVCVGCWERIGRALGTVKGKQRNSLLATARELRDRDLELDGLRTALNEVQAERDSLAEQHQAISDLYSTATGRIQQLEARLAADARAALELIGAGDAVEV